MHCDVLIKCMFNYYAFINATFAFKKQPKLSIIRKKKICFEITGISSKIMDDSYKSVYISNQKKKYSCWWNNTVS